MCSLSWREPKSAQRPVVADVEVPGPFKVLASRLTLKPRDAADPASAATGLEKGLVARWKLDEDPGSCAMDASSKALKADLVGSPRWTGPLTAEGGGLAFNGTSDYLRCDDPTEVTSSECLAVAVWFKAPSSESPEDRGETLASKGEAWRLLRSKKGAIHFALSGPVTPEQSPRRGAAPELTSKKELNDGQWHYAVGAYDGKRAVLYIDGAEEAEMAASGPIAVTSAPLLFGENAVLTGQLFKGALANIRLYQRALSADEVRELYAAERKN